MYPVQDGRLAVGRDGRGGEARLHSQMPMATAGMLRSCPMLSPMGREASKWICRILKNSNTIRTPKMSVKNMPTSMPRGVSGPQC